MKISFLEQAQLELDDAIEYYNDQLTGLGDQFLQEVLETLNRIGTFPDAWHPLSENTRRCQTKRFPYGVIYSIQDNEIIVVAVSNLHRKPDYWLSRVKQE